MRPTLPLAALTLLVALGCGGASMSDAWLEASGDAMNQGDSCMTLGAELIGQCGDAANGTGVAPEDAREQFAECRKQYDDLYRAFEDHPDKQPIDDLADSDQRVFIVLSETHLDLQAQLDRQAATLEQKCTLEPAAAAAAEKATPKATAGTPSGSAATASKQGSTGNQLVDRILRRHKTAVDACAAGKKGKLDVSFDVADDGTVSRASVKGDGLDFTIEGCAAQILTRMRFPSGVAGTYQVEMVYR